MELELEGSGLEAVGNVEVSLPDYMTMLPQAELDVARQSSDRERVFVAAGRKPGTDEIVLLTAASQFMVLKVVEHNIPPGRVFPADFGCNVVVEWPVIAGVFTMPAAWVLTRSKTIDVTLL